MRTQVYIFSGESQCSKRVLLTWDKSISDVKSLDASLIFTCSC